MYALRTGGAASTAANASARFRQGKRALWVMRTIKAGGRGGATFMRRGIRRPREQKPAASPLVLDDLRRDDDHVGPRRSVSLHSDAKRVMSAASDISTELRDVLAEKLPKGFEHFFPKGEKARDPDGDNVGGGQNGGQGEGKNPKEDKDKDKGGKEDKDTPKGQDELDKGKNVGVGGAVKDPTDADDQKSTQASSDNITDKTSGKTKKDGKGNEVDEKIKDYIDDVMNDLDELLKNKKLDDIFDEKPAKNKDETKKDKKSKDDKDKGDNDEKDDGFPRIPLWPIILMGLAIVLADMNLGGGTDITWQDFSNLLLETGQVDRIVVSNEKVARVLMRNPVDMKALAEARRSSRDAMSSGDTGFSMANDKWSSSTDDADRAGEFRAEPSNESQSPAGGRREPNAQQQFRFMIGSVETFERKLDERQRELGISSRDFIPVEYKTEPVWTTTIMQVLPLLLFASLTLILFRGMGGGGRAGGMGSVFRMMKSSANKVKKEMVTTRFKDVAGAKEAKREIMEFVEFLKKPEKFSNLGAKIPKGALLTGPPGTGKTLLARATAGEADVPFYTISGSNFQEMFVGVGPSRVRDLFKEARKNAPCIIFIDEIDAVGGKRSSTQFGGNSERENTLNQLLVEMDGFQETSNVIVLAGTNRPDMLDDALMRPGRFDRQIALESPDIQGRQEIFEVYLQKLPLAGELKDFSGRLAGLTPGFTGAEIKSLCNEAAIVAARGDKKTIEMADFESATDRVIGGLESHRLVTPEERKIVAYHEAGHAVVGWNLEHADPLLKVTIVPRGRSLGYAQYLPKELMLKTKEQITHVIHMALAGRASEQVHFGKTTTGASDDLRKVTGIIYQMLRVYGFGTGIGQLSFPQSDDPYRQDRPFSEATSQKIDEEAKSFLDTAYQQTLDLVTEKRDQVRAVAEALLEKETINHDELVELIGARPFTPHKSYQEFITSRAADKTKQEANKKSEEGEGEREGDRHDGSSEKGETSSDEAREEGGEAREEAKGEGQGKS